jgi:hypothetical protein
MSRISSISAGTLAPSSLSSSTFADSAASSFIASFRLAFPVFKRAPREAVDADEDEEDDPMIVVRSNAGNFDVLTPA